MNGVVAAYIEYQGSQHQSNSKEVLKILGDAYDSNTKAPQGGPGPHARNCGPRTRSWRPVRRRRASRSSGCGLLTSARSEAADRADDLKAALNVAENTDMKDVGTLVGLVTQMRLMDQLQPSSVQQAAGTLQQLTMRQEDLELSGYGVGNEQVRKIGIAVDRARAELADAQRSEAGACIAVLKTGSAAADKKVAQLQAEIDKERSVGQKLGDKEQDYENQSELVSAQPARAGHAGRPDPQDPERGRRPAGDDEHPGAGPA